ncbi:hypothetical protein [Rathayibacter sp. VKM Ac-2801]|uniref:hypothetical protein n=1 Tax=Rathayibacter sp. VKM Ac-2801 TaxID=2609255 RepID=UPI00131F4A70|nr:hypothetical protein [Rathayibacter sp. VKM Ac-2801]QHC71846.1 hypothetical protein GSU45_16580 [Rathayibacter sp. VKM Ac-2801]
MSPRSTAVDIDESPFVVVVSAEVNPRDAGTEQSDPAVSLARPRTGDGGAIRLAQGRVLGPPSSPGTELLLGLLFRRSRRHAEEFAAELSRTGSTWVVDEGIYRFTAVVTASPDDESTIDLVRAPETAAHEVIRLTPVRGKQGWIAEYNESETRDHISNLDGFVSTSFFRDLRSDRIIEYVQWRSADDLTAAFGDERFAEHMSVNSHYSDGEALLFGERSTDAASGDGALDRTSTSTSAETDCRAVAPHDEA